MMLLPQLIGMIMVGEVRDSVFKRLLSYPWYYSVAVAGLLLCFLVGINLVARNSLFTHVLTPELTQSVFYKMQKSSELQGLKGEIKGIDVGKGVLDKRKSKMKDSTTMWANVHLSDGNFSLNNFIADVGGQWRNAPSYYADYHVTAPYSHGDFGSALNYSLVPGPSSYSSLDLINDTVSSFDFSLPTY